MPCSGYKSVRDINDVGATNQSWGLSGGSYSASSVGAEWIRESGDRFTFGLYQPEALTSGSLSLVVPAGRETDGTVLWKKESFQVNGRPDPGLFIAGKMPLSGADRLAKELRFQLQTDPDKGHSIGRASIELSLAF